MRSYRPLLGPVAVVLLFIAGMYLSPFEPHPPPVGPTGAPLGVATWDEGDWSILSSSLRSAEERGLSDLPIGSLMAEVGKGLVGTAYVPGCLGLQSGRGKLTFGGGSNTYIWGGS